MEGFQEVKECAISCMGLVISILGDHLKNEMGTCLPLLLERLRNEITRLTAVKVSVLTTLNDVLPFSDSMYANLYRMVWLILATSLLKFVYIIVLVCRHLLLSLNLL